MNGYTPTTAEVRQQYIDYAFENATYIPSKWHVDQVAAEFDRWLAGVIAEARASA